jgi:riboflavin synthase
MFTGLVQAVGVVTARVAVGDELRLDVRIGQLPGAFRLGDSIALSGVCCTLVEQAGGVGAFHLSRETLARTWLGSAQPGTEVNLEGALRAGEPLGGHLVQGHVDGVGRVVAPIDGMRGGELLAEVPAGLRRYCVEKGSVTLDGVSLTIAGQDARGLRIAVIPHTAAVTTLGRKRAGDPLHVEVDVLAKYVASMLAARGLGATMPACGSDAP